MILLIDDDPELCASLSKYLSAKGCEILALQEGKSGLEHVRSEPIEVLLLDLYLKDSDGMELLRQARELEPGLPIIILTGHADIASAVKAMKLGATDYMVKPFSNDELLLAVEKALRAGRLEREVDLLRRQLKTQATQPVFGSSPAMQKALEAARKVGPTNLTVILEGESGTGKEVMARLLWSSSPRRDRPFVAVDSGALPETLVESELFGYERGAFTGAEKRKPGQFELASGGTIFLDEVTNLSLDIQAKLLRVLQERRIRRLGASRDLPVDVRVLAATNRNLEEEVRRGRFREDLYHRLNEFRIVLPPLRERGEDIYSLAEHFLKESCRQLVKTGMRMSPGFRERLLSHSWPGNVRELKNAVLRAVLLARDVLEPSHLAGGLSPFTGEPPASGRMGTVPAVRLSLKAVSKKARAAAEREIIVQALNKASNNKVRAAKILGIDRKSLYNKLKQYRLMP